MIFLTRAQIMDLTGWDDWDLIKSWLFDSEGVSNYWDLLAVLDRERNMEDNTLLAKSLSNELGIKIL